MKEETKRKFAELRKKAEAQIGEKEAPQSRRTGDSRTTGGAGEEPALPAEVQELLHELEIHQEELEIQNEELKKAHEEVSALHREYSDLYEFAPCGYVTISPKGIITRINLTGTAMLGADRAAFSTSYFGRFVAAESKNAFYEALERSGKSGEKESVELRLLPEGRAGQSGDDETMQPGRAAEEEQVWVQADILAERDESGEVRRWYMSLNDIGERKRAEEELKRSESRFRMIFEESNDAILIHDFEGNFIEVNETACRSLGYTRQELLDLTLAEIHGAEDAPKLPERYEMLKERGYARFESVHRRRDGSEFPVEVSASRIDHAHGPSFIGIARDISRRKQAEVEMRTIHEEFLTILENLEVGVLIISRSNRKILFANSFIHRLLGTELVGRPCTEVLGYSGEICGLCPNFSSRATPDEDDSETLTVEYPVPELEKWFLAHIKPIRWSGEREAVINILTDITSIKEAEELKEEIDRITRHDLKSPLNGLLGVAQLMANDEGLSPAHKEYARLIEDSGKRLLSIIEESFDLYKMERGNYELEAGSVDTERLLEEIRREYDSILRHKQMSLEIRLEGDAPTESEEYAVFGEYMLCYSLFSNLLKNAVEASGKGETVTISLRRESSEQIAVSVWNEKPLPEKIRKNFGKKYSTVGKKRGTGLGIYSAILMARTQDGEIRWSSSQEEGTTVTVFLPAASSGGPA